MILTLKLQVWFLIYAMDISINSVLDIHWDYLLNGIINIWHLNKHYLAITQ